MRNVSGRGKKFIPARPFIILRVTSPVNTLIKCNHSQEEKGNELISIKESLL